MKEPDKRICHITTVHPLFDDRIFYKECITLANNGYDVSLIVTHTHDERIQNINIKALPASGNRIDRILVKSIHAFRKALSVRPASVHIHDPELLWMGPCFWLLGKKTIYDVHEDIEKQILYKDWLGWYWIRYILSRSVLLLEKFFALFFNKIIVVTEDIRQKFPDSKTILVRNFPRLDMIQSAIPEQIEKKSDVVIYIGTLSRERGILELVKAINSLDVELWLIGSWDREQYRRSCENECGWEKTKYFGSMKLEEVYKYLKCSDIGVALLYPTKNYLTSLPVKAFEYMAMGIPMLLSDFPYWKKIFSDCAEFADPLNVNEIAERIKLILNDRILREKMSKHGLSKINTGYSWEVESLKLISLYKELYHEDL